MTASLFFVVATISNVTHAGQADNRLNNLAKASTESASKIKTDTCNINSYYDDSVSAQSDHVSIHDPVPASLKYLNKEVQGTYDVMRDNVINHVKKEVILSLFTLNENGFAPKNIASYVSAATKPFLPFSFANGVKIVDVMHKEGTIIYKAETPTHINHNHTVLLTKAGIASATQTVCNDSTMVEDLLARDVIIQYDYYDTNNVFICSFNIKDIR